MAPPDGKVAIGTRDAAGFPAVDFGVAAVELLATVGHAEMTDISTNTNHIRMHRGLFNLSIIT